MRVGDAKGSQLKACIVFSWKGGITGVSLRRVQLSLAYLHCHIQNAVFPANVAEFKLGVGANSFGERLADCFDEVFLDFCFDDWLCELERAFEGFVEFVWDIIIHPNYAQPECECRKRMRLWCVCVKL
jgi:hypothetical protein